MDISLTADLDGKILAYDYRAQLVYVMTFDYPRVQFSLTTSTMCRTNVMGLITRHDLSVSHDVCPGGHSPFKVMRVLIGKF